VTPFAGEGSLGDAIPYRAERVHDVGGQGLRASRVVAPCSGLSYVLRPSCHSETVMRFKRWPLFPIAAVGAFTVGCAASNAPAVPEYTAADSAAVSATIEKWRTTILARDFDGWATTVSPDVVLQPPNIKPLVGRAAAVEYIKSYPVITKFDVVIHEQVGLGDVAYDRGSFMIAVTLPDGTAGSDTGSFMSVFRRQADTTWAHDRVIWNSSLPVVAPPPAPKRR